MDNSRESNIFNAARASFRAALPALAAAKNFALPVAGENAGSLTIHTLIPRMEGGRALLQAFTDGGALTTPFIKFQPLETALIFFHAPRHDAFVFDPGRAGRCSAAASRADISLLAGCLQAGAKAPADPLATAAAEFNAGELHKAHFYYAMEAEKGRGAEARLPMCAALIELGLYQDAYDSLKTERTPEAMLLLASVHRRTGNRARAVEALAVAGRAAQLQDRKALETAWLQLAADSDDEAENGFERLTAAGQVRTEALSGLGAARAKKAFKTGDSALLAQAIAALESALTAPSPGGPRIAFQLGNIYFRSGNFDKAGFWYRQTAARAPGLQALANLAAALIRSGGRQEAEALTARIALTDPAAAKLLAGKMQAENSAPRYGSPGRFSSAQPQPAHAPPPGFEIESFPGAPAPAGEQLPSALPGQAPEVNGRAPGSAPLPSAMPGPERGAPPEINSRKQFSVPPPSAMPSASAPAPAAQSAPPPAIASFQPGGQNLSFETMQSVMRSVPDFSSQERRPEDFMSGAFRLASALERESGAKVHFNRQGLAALETKLLSAVTVEKAQAGMAGTGLYLWDVFKTAVRGEIPQAGFELAKDSAAFICYFLQERHKGRLVKLPGFEPWCWPMIFEHHGRKLTTYPAQRAWRLVWDDKLPDPGWMVNYSDWLISSLDTAAVPPSGAEAARNAVMSHPERLIDTKTEHRRIMLLNQTLPELSGISAGRSGLLKLAEVIKHNFRPHIPPSADGWRLLRCCGHILAEILIKDLEAAWYNTDGEDGGWSLRLPWGTCVFPLGKVYKTAAAGDDLTDYYGGMLLEKKIHRNL